MDDNNPSEIEAPSALGEFINEKTQVSHPKVPGRLIKWKEVKNSWLSSDTGTEMRYNFRTDSLKQRIAVDEDDDEDRSFLLSSIKDIKSIPSEMKPDAKVEIISVIKK